MMLVDYDNVDRTIRRQGVKGVVRGVLERLPQDAIPLRGHVVTRLYGGWYDEDRLSVTARNLIGEIERDFPCVVSLSTLGRRQGVYVAAELARALWVRPTANLMNTYRVRGAPRNLRPRTYPFDRCALSATECPLLGTYHLLKSSACPEAECPVRLGDVVKRAEQKLVDTMLTADLVYAATRRPSTVIVASNDDDLWPAIHTAVALGTTVHHVHPVSGRRTPDIYAATVEGNYFQYSF